MPSPCLLEGQRLRHGSPARAACRAAGHSARRRRCGRRVRRADRARQVPGYSGAPSGACGAAADCSISRWMSARVQKHGYSRPRAVSIVQHRAILRQMLRLHPHLAIPVEAEPCQVLQDRGGEFGAAACRVDVLQAQQEPPARLARAAPGEQRAERVAEMQIAGRAWREARDDRFAHRCWLGSLRASAAKPSVGRRTITRVASGTRARNQAATSSIRGEPTLSSSIV